MQRLPYLRLHPRSQTSMQAQNSGNTLVLVSAFPGGRAAHGGVGRNAPGAGFDPRSSGAWQTCAQTEPGRQGTTPPER